MAEAALFGAIDIGGTKIAVAAVDANGRIAARREFATGAAAGPASGLRHISEALRHCEAASGQNLEAIGIGCTGPVDPITGVIGAVDLLPGWEGTPLVRLLQAEFVVPVLLENDADAAALGEWHANGADRFLFVSVGTGIGAGIILDGHIYRGLDGAHPELGHQTLDPSGPQCYCGAKGCWESLASGPAIARWYSNGPATAADIFKMAREGQPLAQRAVERQAYYLGLGIANLITIFCPARIALGGGVMRSADLLLDGIQGVIRSQCGLVPAGRVDVSVAALGGDAALIGAARLAMNREASC